LSVMYPTPTWNAQYRLMREKLANELKRQKAIEEEAEKKKRKVICVTLSENIRPPPIL
uniref:Uncharacterized protein n=1 Tax=Caenorhabditis japonica TaxID=281687 RepID=A0A8R1IV66_CAEJA